MLNLRINYIFKLIHQDIYRKYAPKYTSLVPNVIFYQMPQQV